MPRVAVCTARTTTQPIAPRAVTTAAVILSLRLLGRNYFAIDVQPTAVFRVITNQFR